MMINKAIIPFIDQRIKGQPYVQLTDPIRIQKNNIIKTTYREPNPNSIGWRVFTKKTIEFKYNGQGLPITESTVMTIGSEIGATEQKMYNFECL